MVAKSYNNNIFKIITELDKKNYNFFRSYNKLQYDELQPYTLLRWLSSVQNESKDSINYIKKCNELNKLLFQLSPEHKNLLLNFLCAIGSGHWVKHAWVAIPKENKVNKSDRVVKDFYHYNDDEWEIKKQSLSKEEIEDVLNYLGITKT